MRFDIGLLAILPAIFATACAGPSKTSVVADATTQTSFDRWADEFAADWVRASPQLATRVRYFSGDQQDALDRQLSLIGEWDYAFGAKAFDDRRASAKQGLEALTRFDLNALTTGQQTSLATLRWTLDDTRAASAFPHHRYIFDHFNGLQLDLINHLTQSQTIQTPRDVQNYLARLELIATRVDDGINEARAAEVAGIIPPKVIIQRAIGQIDDFLKQSPRDNVFIATLVARIEAMVHHRMPASDRLSAVARAEKTAKDSIIPAYRRIRVLLVDQLKRASDDVGVWQLPRGDAYCAQQLATFTTTRMTAGEIHELGLRDVAHIEAAIDGILRQLGYVRGTIEERYEQAEKDAQPPSWPDPRPQLLANYEKWVRDAEKRAAEMFDLRPKARVEVRREPALSEATASAHYNDPAPDGSRPGLFLVPLPGPPYKILHGRSLTYYEAVPGHHFQIALQQELPDLPRYRQLGVFGGNSAYVEGWALYAERVADEAGWYDGGSKRTSGLPA